MAIVKIVESKSKRTKCSCCGDIIPTCQKYSRIERTNYCHNGNCHTKYMPMNHDIESEHDDDDGECGLRRREAYASYRAAGCSESFWTDQDAGYFD